MSETAPPPSPRTPPLLAGAAAAAACTAIAAQIALVARTAVDAPVLDDWDVVVGFLVYWDEARSIAERSYLLFDPHNEHLLALPRLAVWSVARALGRIDFVGLGLLGQAAGLGMLVALAAGYRRDRARAWRIAAFAPSVLLFVHPLGWTAITSPTVSLSNLGVLGFAAACFAALSVPGRAAVLFAAACAAAASLCSANGILVAPIASAVPFARGRRRLALAWLLAGIVGAALVLALTPGDHGATAPTAWLSNPWPVVPYVLYFAGMAGGLAHPWASLAVGTTLVVGFALALRGPDARRDVVPLALAAFVLASIAANALLRAHQGAAAPLAQPRYALYASALLASLSLVWIGRVPAQREARALCLALALACAFGVAAFAQGAPAAQRAAEDAEGGIVRWWENGRGGLRHPDGRKAAFFLRRALDRGLLELPVRVAPSAPQPVSDAPAATQATPGSVDALRIHGASLTLLTHHAGSPPESVEVALASDASHYRAPARVVAPPARGDARRSATARRREFGVHAHIALGDLPAGRYRLGVVVRNGAIRRTIWMDRTLDLPARP